MVKSEAKTNEIEKGPIKKTMKSKAGSLERSLKSILL